MLGGFDGSRFIQVSFIIGIEFTEGILQPKDLALLELRIFPAIALISLKAGVSKKCQVS